MVEMLGTDSSAVRPIWPVPPDYDLIASCGDRGNRGGNSDEQDRNCCTTEQNGTPSAGQVFRFCLFTGSRSPRCAFAVELALSMPTRKCYHGAVRAPYSISNQYERTADSA